MQRTLADALRRVAPGRQDHDGGRVRLIRHRLRARAGLAMGLASLILSGSLAVLAYVLVRDALLDQRESAALRQAYTNARVVRSALRADDPGIAEVLSGLQVGPDGGTVLATPTETFTSSVDVGIEDVPATLIAGVGEGHAGRQRMDTDTGPRLVVGVPIVAADAAYFEITSVEETDRNLDVLASSLAIGGAAATAIGAGVGAAVSGAVLRPLRGMARAARRIVDGEVDSRLDPESDWDLAPLADAFNEALDELRERIRREARFASDVAHELRGPLTVLAAAVDMVERRRTQLPPEAAQAVEALDTQVRAFNQLVLDLLEISRFETGSARLDARDVELKQLVTAVLDERPVPRPPIDHPDRAELRADVDPRRIQQVLVNLLDNADAYASGATAILLRRTSNGAVRITVDDDGPGVPASERESIFDRFARGSTSAEESAPRGSGLGLALCASHVELHGGRIWVGTHRPAASPSWTSPPTSSTRRAAANCWPSPRSSAPSPAGPVWVKSPSPSKVNRSTSPEVTGRQPPTRSPGTTTGSSSPPDGSPLC